MNKEKKLISSETKVLSTLSLKNIQELKQQIGIFFKTWMIEWIKSNLQYITIYWV